MIFFIKNSNLKLKQKKNGGTCGRKGAGVSDFFTMNSNLKMKKGVAIV